MKLFCVQVEHRGPKDFFSSFTVAAIDAPEAIREVCRKFEGQTLDRIDIRAHEQFGAVVLHKH